MEMCPQNHRNIGGYFGGNFPWFPVKEGGEIAENVLDSLRNRGHFQFLERSCVMPLNTEWTHRFFHSVQQRHTAKSSGRATEVPWTWWSSIKLFEVGGSVRYSNVHTMWLIVRCNMYCYYLIISKTKNKVDVIWFSFLK